MNSFDATTTATQSSDRILIIPAAGRGVRFKELGKQYPKCLLPVEGKPILVHTLQRLMDAVDFAHVVVTAADDKAAKQIDDILHAYNLQDDVLVVSLGGSSPSPAYSLNAALVGLARHEGTMPNYDVTVFLSDMIPTSTYGFSKMKPDAWGVVYKSKGDFARWCMVEDDSMSSITEFYDKPSEQPPTTLAACGVYRYSSSYELVHAYQYASEDLSSSNREMQFSDVAKHYMRRRDLRTAVFSEAELRDFGTLEEYLQNNGLANKARSFNTVTLNAIERSVTKSSAEDVAKINREAKWFKNLPTSLKRYAPELYSREKDSYTLAQIRSNNLRDVALYVDRSYETWKGIFESVREYWNHTIRANGNDFVSASTFWHRMTAKTVARTGDADPWVQWRRAEDWDFIREASVNAQERLYYYHGDLHFANMFYCFNYDELKLIDPRGEQRGSIMYDMAKLAHSVFGRYDYIDANLYSIDQDGNPIYYDNGHEEIERAFKDVLMVRMGPRGTKMLYLLVAYLFFSMIPLHSDNEEHQRLFKLEGYRMLELADAIDIGS
jgi:NDP-sugar pyrophosphorylase family protein